MATESTAMGDKQAAYAERRRALTHGQLIGWVNDLIALGENPAPAPVYQQDRREPPVCPACEARSYGGECRCGTAGTEPDPAGPPPDAIRAAWLAGRDAAAYAALRAAVDGQSALAVAARAALAMPDDEVAL